MFYAMLVALFVVDGNLVQFEIQDKMELSTCHEMVGDYQEHNQTFPVTLSSGKALDIPAAALFCIPFNEA